MGKGKQMSWYWIHLAIIWFQFFARSAAW